MKTFGFVAGIAGGMLVPIFFGAFIIVVGGRDVRHSRECQTWPSTRGKIVASHVVSSFYKNNSTTYYYPYTRYAYSVNGGSYTGDRRSFREMRNSNKAVIEEYITK